MSDVAPEPDDEMIVETGGTGPPPLVPEDQRVVDPTVVDPTPVPDDERVEPGPDPDIPDA